MSSLGDLLLLHSKQQANKAEKVSDSDNDCDNDNNRQKSEQLDIKTSQTNQEKSLSSPKLQTTLPTQLVNTNDNNNDNSSVYSEQSNESKAKQLHQKQRQQAELSPSHNVSSLIPKYVEKNDVEEAQSDASSTDDYVRELLDPNDRPKNVWHVVEAPKVEQSVDSNKRDHSRSAENSRDREYGSSPANDRQEPLYRSRYDVRRVDDSNNDNTNSAMASPSTPPPPPPPPLLDSPLRSPSELNPPQVNRGEDERSNDKHLDGERKSSSRSDGRYMSRHNDVDRERSSSSRRNRNKDEHGRDGYRDRDRHRSSRRGHDYSEEGDRGHSRNRSSRHRRSRSRSPRNSSSRRLGRSRSNSTSPVGGKRNSRTILVMQLSPRVVTRDLEDFFSDIGRVREVRLIMDSKTRRHKGIAYIEFESSHSATKALGLKGKKLYGAPLDIQPVQKDGIRQGADERHSSSSQHTTNYNATNTTSHSSSRSYLPPNCYRVYVGGLNVNLTEDMIRSVFEPFGPIIRLELMRDRVTNVSRGYAFITYADIEDGQNAVQNLDGFELAGKNLRVSKSADKNERFGTAGQNPIGTTSAGPSTQDYGSIGSGGGGGASGTDYFNDINDPYANHQKFR